MLTYLIASVWIINGLIYKVMNLVPRHQEIVSYFIGDGYAREATIAIGLLEVVLALWYLAQIKPCINAVVQMSAVFIMNVLEFIFVPELLLWGRFNIVLALFFIGLVYFNEFVSRQKLHLNS